MTPERFQDLQHGKANKLTPREMEDGWHWCAEMDDLLCKYGSDDCFCAKAERRPSELEKDLEKRVCDWADDLGGYALKLKDEERGWPDRTIWLPGGRVIVPELKRPGRQKRYEQQKRWVERLQRLGHAAGFCETLTDVERLLLTRDKRGRV